ncbi:D-alanine--D-alanine ligase [Candidatus Bealeia paramacronuclearis]|uniref:D-alanine--D-alanine ligase n=1 Tax=Candidatus Bealeia paramacronuclearis TaxID=1921001 RepID=A0ABZ2C144_9PROT|nr:D-alanine--D-alanine ligase [Candidatus Bealeia paramacronuclearis]
MKPVAKKRVAVLMGGFSAEREVSLSSAEGAIKALESLGHDVRPIDVTRDIAKLIQDLTPKPDVVVNILHGRWGEDGCVQGFLEMMDIPYTHSGVLASAIAMNKVYGRHMCEKSGIQVPPGKVVTLEDFKKGDPFPRPYVIKPIGEGSSVGVHIVREKDNYLPTEDNWTFGSEVLVEKYIPGREIQVAVIGGKAIGAIEIRPKNGFYDYEAKYTDGKADHLMPAPIHPEAYAKVMQMAEDAHRILGCKGVSRSDFRYDDTKGKPGEMYFLELNSQPGMTPLSLVPEIAAYHGITYPQLMQWMVEDATCHR